MGANKRDTMTSTRMLTLWLVLCAYASAWMQADAVQFDVRRRTEKCLSDEVAEGSLVVIHYTVLGVTQARSGVSITITDPQKKYLKQDSNIDTSSDDTHKFSFYADAGGSYSVCFYNTNDNEARVMLDFKHGVEAKDYTEVAKREHLMPVEKELRKMEDAVDEIHREMLYMREREAVMRSTNESTNSRVLWFSFFSIANQLRRTAVRHVVGMLRRRQLRELFCTWRVTAQTTTRRWSQAVHTISNVCDRLDLKSTVRAFGKLKAHAHEERQHEVALEVHKDIAVAQDRMRVSTLWAGLVTMKALVRKYALARQAAGFLRWRRVVESQRDQANRLVLAGTKMNAILVTCRRVSLHRALLRWRWISTLETHVLHHEKAQETEKSLVEAKDCVFALSRAKTRLEEKLQGARGDVQQMSNQLRENRTELQLVKHGYVTTVMRKVERQWLRAIFTEWRVQTELTSCAKELQLQVEAAELKAMERDKYARSLDDYNKVLRNDLERFQFFSHDKRIAVDVLTKKLLREEEKLKQMEEQHVTLEEKVVTYKSQLTTLLEWKGTTLPSSLVGICKDVAVNHLYGLFMQHAVAGDSIDDPASVFPSKDPNNAAFRLPLDAFVLLLRGLGLLSNNARVELSELVRRNVPEYATSRGLNFADFVSTLNAVVNELLQGGNDSQILNHVKVFWMQLLGRVALPPSVTSSERGTCDSASLHSTRSAWAGQLSEDILQNQEKLLAVLEHETAVVERAVMEKSSLKHTYSPTSEHSVSTVSAFHEYQCDPVAPLEAQPRITGEFLSAGLDAYANWIQSGQVRDLFLAFRQPLQRVLGKFPDAAHAGLSAPEIFTMLEDMRLFPSYLSRDLVQYHLGRLSGRDKRLSTSRLGELLGSCALELFAKSLPAANSAVLQLSVREILLSFFCDLGFLLDSEIPAPPRICFVGMEVENILWPLFEYYAGNELHEASRSSVRVVMTLDGFIKFMAEIANAGPSAEGLFRRVLGETRRSNASPTSSAIMMLHFDEFYVAIAYLQQERNPTTKYPSLGDAVKHWMQQTQ
ncbi:TPA: hypothetical protein N0F65_010889 [Lagenidium giganteum]|uniref:GOLD domain-containing protein n=1 Tax=Lagenidium giganteum TaxID=4803 RepID=A0AAV2YI93_9STRA|nr:TPA: hypothetical protein N0F65_010889 [Lagenidium giganteum]